MRIACIDVGSNSIKLVIVEAAASDSFAVLGREKEVVRLGQQTLAEGRLAPDAIRRAAETVQRFNAIAISRGAEVVAIATASVREAENASEFIEEVERRTGVRVEVISGVEEARLIGLAVAHERGMRDETLLNIDIGGGSTELSLFRGTQPVRLFSVKVGAVGLTEQFLSADPPKASELRALKAELQRALERPARVFRTAKWQKATGTSGTILALGGAISLKLLNGETESAQPVRSEIKLKALESLNERLSKMDVDERCAVRGISAQRAEIIVAGGQILEATMRALGIKNLSACDWALREGVIIDRLRELEIESRPPLEDREDPRLRGVHAVGKRFEYEEGHAHHVAKLAEQIFDTLAPAFGLNRHQRTLLSSAALLHDVGYIIAHDSHHKHSQYLIKNSELTGFSEAERLVIANVARYHSRALPKERHADFAALKETDREAVWRLGAILRVADALDRRHDGRVLSVACERDKNSIHLRLESSLSCSHEMIAVEQKRDMFVQAFGCKLKVSRAPLRAETLRAS